MPFLSAIETTTRSIESKPSTDRKSIGTSAWSGEEITSEWAKRVNHCTRSRCFLIGESFSRALLLLRRKKMLEMQLDKSEGILENVERMVIDLSSIDHPSGFSVLDTRVGIRSSSSECSEQPQAGNRIVEENEWTTQTGRYRTTDGRYARSCRIPECTSSSVSIWSI